MKTILLIALVFAMASAQFFGKCECGEGKYYDKATGDCVSPPTPTVQNCAKAKYENGKYDAAKCEFCNHKYMKENDTTCKEIPSADLIANCMDQTSVGHCNRCNSGYAQHNQGKLCGQLPSNCSYLDHSKDTPVCQGCETKYKLNGNACESVTNDVANCSRWSEKTKCSDCAEGYYLENETTCTKQDAIANCKLLYTYRKGCDECEWGYSRSDDKLKCEKGAITDCEVHSRDDKTTCASCKQGYQLNAERTTCTAFATKPTNFDSNCQTYDKDSKCTHCTYTYKWDKNEYETFPKYGYTDSVQSCSKKCPSSGSDASILSFVLASLALLALLF